MLPLIRKCLATPQSDGYVQAFVQFLRAYTRISLLAEVLILGIGREAYPDTQD